LKAIAPPSHLLERQQEPKPYKSKLLDFFSQIFYEKIQRKSVIDFGCFIGLQAMDMAGKEAGKVIGIDIQDKWLVMARNLAAARGLSDRCAFCKETTEKADVIISKDAFEHFADPAQILWQMSQLLKTEGYVQAAFGPLWYHPYGGHLFSVFPWAHLIFTEKALIRWRSHLRSDGARRFKEVGGGLNLMTIKKFLSFVDSSPFQVKNFEPVPIKGISLLKMRVIREFGSSIVRCTLVLKKFSNTVSI
jgi:SAM-dependent methyltransferase